MKSYNILLSKDGETLSLTEKGGTKTVSTYYLMTTSALIESHFDIITEKISLTTENIKEAQLKLNTILESEVTLWPDNTASLDSLIGLPGIQEKNIIKEISVLYYAAVNWIDSNKFSFYENDVSLNPREITVLNYLQKGIMQSPIMPILFDMKPTRFHEANTLLPLAWAEIWYCIENNIRARSCPYCGVIYSIPPNNPQKATCLRPACKKQYEINRHGGIEAYRQWEKSRKGVKSKRPPGRPKKQ